MANRVDALVVFAGGTAFAIVKLGIMTSITNDIDLNGALYGIVSQTRTSQNTTECLAPGSRSLLLDFPESQLMRQRSDRVDVRQLLVWLIRNICSSLRLAI